MSTEHPEVESLTKIESMLSKLWAETLGVPRVGLDQNLFDLGGDSLLAFKILSRVKTEYGVEVTPEMVFDLPTVRELARAVDSAVGAAK